MMLNNSKFDFGIFGMYSTYKNEKKYYFFCFNGRIIEFAKEIIKTFKTFLTLSYFHLLKFDFRLFVQISLDQMLKIFFYFLKFLFVFNTLLDCEIRSFLCLSL